MNENARILSAFENRLSGKFIPETRCSVPKRAIGDFQRGPTWWTSKSDCRRRTCAVTRLNRDQVGEILRLISCENLVCDRKEFIFDTFIYSEPVKRSKNRSDVTRFRGSGDSTSKRILDVLESFYLRLRKVIVQ